MLFGLAFFAGGEYDVFNNGEVYICARSPILPRNEGCVLRKRWRMLVAAVLLAACLLSFPAMAVTFTDVSGHWAESYITQAADRQLIQGYDGKYSPGDSVTRAQLATILWRACGSPQPKSKATFTDLTQDWYLEPVAWAQETGVMNGIGEGKFGPDGTVTREQLATVLHRMAGSPMDAMLFTQFYDADYPDSGDVSSFAKQAIYWCIYRQVYCGESSLNVGKTLDPKAPASRGQIAVMIVRYLDRNH